MSATLAAILGGAAGAVALVGVLVIIIWFCFFHARTVSRTSEADSSDPSVQCEFLLCVFHIRASASTQSHVKSFWSHTVGRTAGVELSLRDAKRFDIEELSLATKNFSDKSLIGLGKFGEVYKGLLHDGMLVAIKRRSIAPSPEFVEEVMSKFNLQEFLDFYDKSYLLQIIHWLETFGNKIFVIKKKKKHFSLFFELQNFLARR